MTMQLEHRLSVPAPIDVVWPALLDPQRVAPCVPGATLTGVDGDSFTGTVKVKVGPITLLYKGTGTFSEIDEQARRAVLKADAKDTRGNGTVKATVTLTLSEEGDHTTGTVATDLSITGKPAQFGRGMIADVGGKIIEQFSACLSEKLAVTAPDAGTESTGASAAQATTPEPAAATAEEVEPLDLVHYARGSAIKRIGPLAAAAMAILIIGALVRRLRSRD
jgi:carbon monoxide dehydrogenase subunit G